LKTGERLPEPTLDVQRDTLIHHYNEMLEHYGEYRGSRNARKHLAWYSKGKPGSTQFRAEIMQIDEPKDVRQAVMDFYAPLIEKMAA